VRFRDVRVQRHGLGERFQRLPLPFLRAQAPP
jgi:hypothetical protein